MPKMTFLQAIHAAQFEEMTRDPSVFIVKIEVGAAVCSSRPDP